MINRTRCKHLIERLGWFPSESKNEISRSCKLDARRGTSIERDTEPATGWKAESDKAVRHVKHTRTYLIP